MCNERLYLEVYVGLLLVFPGPRVFIRVSVCYTQFYTVLQFV